MTKAQLLLKLINYPDDMKVYTNIDQLNANTPLSQLDIVEEVTFKDGKGIIIRSFDPQVDGIRSCDLEE